MASREEKQVEVYFSDNFISIHIWRNAKREIGFIMPLPNGVINHVSKRIKRHTPLQKNVGKGAKVIRLDVWKILDASKKPES